MDRQVVTLGRLLQTVQVESIVCLDAKNRLAIIATLNHVLGLVLGEVTGQTGHVSMMLCYPTTDKTCYYWKRQIKPDPDW
jgi:hypothetical protein